jgi:hypothetical protein
MQCTPIEEKEATEQILEWAGAECLDHVRVRQLEAWTAALIQDVDTQIWGREVVVRADQMAAQVCHLWDLRPQRLLLIWQENECWPRWIAWLMGSEVYRRFWIATQGTEVWGQTTWKWMASDKEAAQLLLGESLAEPCVQFERDGESLAPPQLVRWGLFRFHRVTQGATVSRFRAAKLLQRRERSPGPWHRLRAWRREVGD